MFIYFLLLLISIVSFLLGKVFPIVGAPICSLLIGLTIAFDLAMGCSFVGCESDVNEGKPGKAGNGTAGRAGPHPTMMLSCGYRMGSGARGRLNAYAMVMGPRRPTIIAAHRMNREAALSASATPTE